MADNPKEIKKVLTDTSSLVENTLKSVASQVGDIFRDALSQTDTATKTFGKDLQSQLNSLARSTDKMIENQIKIKSGAASSRDISKQILEYETKREVLQKRIKNLSEENPKIAAKLAKQLNDVNIANEDYLKALNEQYAQLSGIERKVGTLGSLFKGISKIPIASEFFKAEEGIRAMNKAAAEGRSKLGILGEGFKAASKGIGDIFIGKFIGATVNAFKTMDKDAGNLARSLNLTYDASFKLRKELSQSALSSGNLYATGEKYTKSLLEMNEALGAASSFDKSRIDSYTKLREVSKFEADVLNDINKSSLINKKDVLDITKARLGQIQLYKIQNGLAINERQVLKDIANTSNTIKLNFIGSDSALAKAATQARAMGIDLNKIDSVAGSLVDFESSIKSQMETQVLLGKEINLDKARYYANTNQTAKLLEEINKQGLTEAEFTKASRIERESYAQTLGMSVEDLSKMYMEQKALKNIGAQDLEQAKQKFDQLVKSKGIAEATKRLGDEQLAKQFQQQTIQDRAVQAQERFSAAAETLAGALQPIVNAFAKMAEFLAKSEKFLKGMVILGGVLVAKRIGQSLFGGGGTGGGGAMDMVGSMMGKGSQFRGGSFSAGKELLKGGGGSLLKSAGKAGGVGALISGLMNVSEYGFSGESLGRTALSAGGAFLGGLGGSALLPGAGTVAGGVAGGMAGDYLGDAIFGKKEEVPQLANGGLVSQGGIAKVDSGEVYLGKNSIQTLNEMLGELKRQSSFIQQQGNIQLNIDGAPVAAAVARNAPGNFAASNLGPRPLDYTI